MHRETGEITDEAAMRAKLADCMSFERTCMPVDMAKLTPIRRAELIRTGRTVLSPRSRCVCGSGKRFQSCCMLRAENR